MNPTYDVFSDNQMKLIKQDTIAIAYEKYLRWKRDGYWRQIPVDNSLCIQER